MQSAHVIGFIVGAGPFLAANLLVVIQNLPAALKVWYVFGCACFDIDEFFLQSPRKVLTYPFHKERMVGLLGFHFLFGVIFNILPVYHLVTTILLPPGESIACRLWGCGVSA